MIYNMDFLFAALAFLIVILYHFLSQRKGHGMQNRIFAFFIVLGITDIVFDILCTFLIAMESPEYKDVTMLALTFLYLMQAAVPYATFCYTQTLRNCQEQKLKRTLYWFGVSLVFMVILVLFNVKYGMLFYFDQNARYIRGPLYMCMYYYALFFVVIIAASSFVYYRELGKKKFLVIWEFLLIEVVCVVIQAIANNLLMTGFGIALGITVLFITINNPYEVTDNLTGTLDKQYFEQWFENEVRRGKKRYFLTVDLFQMKRINKIYGNSAGDQILIQAARELRGLHSQGKVFRIAGNRFLLPTESLAEYETVRDRMMTLFQSPFLVERDEVYCPGIICGISEMQAIKKSDLLLAYAEYLVSLVPNTEETILIQDTNKTLEGFQYEREIERFLYTAIEEDLFEVYYQPVYSLKNGKFVTLEALSRLRHPSLGAVSPEIFISLAEKNGQIAEIGLLQFRKMCKFIKQYEEITEKIWNVKFNLSPLELLKPGYSHALIETIREFDLPCRFFQFEITETVATEYCDALEQVQEEFREAGIGLCLDDFGSGYANMNTVLKLPFSAIKLDRSLLAGICTEQQVAYFYRSIVSVLKNLGYDVIAEGVEKKEEVELLQQWGVDMIQGYYYSPPVPGDIMAGRLNENDRNV